jgi:hypothetical protein
MVAARGLERRWRRVQKGGGGGGGGEHGAEVEQRRAAGLGSLQPCGSEGWRVHVFVRKEEAAACGGRRGARVWVSSRALQFYTY